MVRGQELKARRCSMTGTKGGPAACGTMTPEAW